MTSHYLLHKKVFDTNSYVLFEKYILRDVEFSRKEKMRLPSIDCPFCKKRTYSLHVYVLYIYVRCENTRSYVYGYRYFALIYMFRPSYVSTFHVLGIGKKLCRLAVKLSKCS